MAGPYQHGAGTIILMDASNPPTTDISVDVIDSKLDRARKEHATTAYGATAEGRQGGLRDLKVFDWEMNNNATNHAAMRTLSDLDTVYVIVRPFGTGTGKKQYLFHGFFISFPLEAKATELTKRKYQLAVDGDWTESTQP